MPTTIEPSSTPIPAPYDFRTMSYKAGVYKGDYPMGGGCRFVSMGTGIVLYVNDDGTDPRLVTEDRVVSRQFTPTDEKFVVVF